VSREDRSRENEAAILALALAAGLGDEPARRAALAALPEVCRSGTDVVRFAEFVEASRRCPARTRRAPSIADTIFVRGALWLEQLGGRRSPRATREEEAMELLHMQARRHIGADAPRSAAEIALRSRASARALERDRRRIAPGREPERSDRLSRPDAAAAAQRTGARALGA
jgi:hypothetical protein